MHHECIHQCTINALITASSMHRAIHHQCIHCIKCINFVHSVLPFIISASSVHLSMHHQCIHQCIHHCIIKVINQCIINASLIHNQCLHQRIINPLSVHLSMHSSMHLVINIPSMHHHCIKCINSFFHLLNSFKLVHLHCCSFIRFFVAVTLSAFLLSFLNSLYPFNSFFRPSFLRSLFVPVFISSTIILFLCLANS